MGVLRFLRLILILEIGSGSMRIALAAERLCSLKDEEAASDDLTRLSTQSLNSLSLWRSLHESFQRFAKCDDGFIAEGYSNVVTKGLAQNWSTVAKLERIVRRDAKFKAFVLTHIDATADVTDLMAVRKSATSNCKHCSLSLCKELAQRASAALGNP